MIEINIQKRLWSLEGYKNLHIDCKIVEGEFIGLIGGNGIGKTSLLKMISGLMTPDKGYIKVNNSIWFDNSKKICLDPQDRDIAFVFQEYALFPHMTVYENLSFAQKQKDTNFINEVISLFELEHLADRKPNFLSGGQQQRVALARALVQKSKILLLDEALSAQDDILRPKIQSILKDIHCQFGYNIVMVSHKLEELHKMADRIFILKDGKLDQHQVILTAQSIEATVEKITIDGNRKTIHLLSDQNNLTVSLENDDFKLEKGDKLRIIKDRES